MSHEEIKGIIPAYAVGAADEAEVRQLAQHLRWCRECRTLLASYRALSEDLLYAVPGVMAPVGIADQLKRRLARRPIAKSTDGQPAGLLGGRRTEAAWPVLALLLAALLFTNVYWLNRISALEHRISAPDRLVGAPRAVLYGDAAENAKGVVYVTDTADLALLCVYQMPVIPVDQTYQVWLIRDDERDSGGLLQVSPGGYGIILLDLQRPLDEYNGMGITVEPAGGSEGPTSPRVLGGKL